MSEKEIYDFDWINKRNEDMATLFSGPQPGSAIEIEQRRVSRLAAMAIEAHQHAKSINARMNDMRTRLLGISLPQAEGPNVKACSSCELEDLGQALVDTGNTLQEIENCLRDLEAI